ncbi:MAG: PRC-barrel domain-containing protein [Thermofilaceae archaeon]|nr:PRC-barrel domain-containing protein [Thermofilaceae archaeon]MCX8181237.1 PRC-barrel domain-containing protein [Thermofilaceae archaeon]MDW8003544.1 PRC-barrel domain-containing protein [Thermofilaceae archaeon]
MRIKEIIGKEVLTEDGVSVGSVEDLEVENWTVSKLVLRLNRDAAKNLGSRFSLRPKGSVSPSFVKGVGDYITLNVSFNQIKESIKLE